MELIFIHIFKITKLTKINMKMNLKKLHYQNLQWDNYTSQKFYCLFHTRQSSTCSIRLLVINQEKYVHKMWKGFWKKYLFIHNYNTSKNKYLWKWIIKTYITKSFSGIIMPHRGFTTSQDSSKTFVNKRNNTYECKINFKIIT